MGIRMSIALVALCMLVGAFGPLGSGLAILAFAIVVGAAKGGVAKKIAQSAKVLPIFLLPLLTFLFLQQGSVQLFGFYAPLWLVKGANTFCYLFGVFLLWKVMLEGAGMAEVSAGLRGFGVPRQVSFMMPLAIESSRLFARKARGISAAQAARGGGGIFALLVPFFNSLFAKAKALSLSLESRGFSAEDL